MTAPHAIQYTPEGPQPLVRDIAPGTAYPVHALGPLRAAVDAVQGITQAPIAIPAQSALAMASLAVQGFADVETLGWPRPLSLYALTIARSGERKSACDAPLMAALRDHEREQATAQRDAMESWCNAHALWKGERDRILADAKRGKGGKRTAAQADLEALGPEPSAPPSADRTVTEPRWASSKTTDGLCRCKRGRLCRARHGPKRGASCEVAAMWFDANSALANRVVRHPGPATSATSATLHTRVAIVVDVAGRPFRKSLHLRHRPGALRRVLQMSQVSQSPLQDIRHLNIHGTMYRSRGIRSHGCVALCRWPIGADCRIVNRIEPTGRELESSNPHHFNPINGS